jgi:hypothetical protein
MSIRKKVAASAALPPVPTARSRPSPSRHVALKVALLFGGLGAVAWWFLGHPMSQTRNVVAGATTVALLAFLGVHRREGRHWVSVVLEWGIVATLVLTLAGVGVAPQPGGDKHQKGGNAEAGFTLPAIQGSTATACAKVPLCRQVLDWYNRQRDALGRRGR